jgi:hypothetical protein
LLSPWLRRLPRLGFQRRRVRWNIYFSASFLFSQLSFCPCWVSRMHPQLRAICINPRVNSSVNF